MKLIDKDAVAANMEKRYNECLKRAKIVDAEYWNGKADAYRDMLVVLDTLEVKEVDLEKTLIGFQNRYAYENSGELPSAIEIAKHFFELGLKSKSSYVSTPNIDDTLKEMGIDHDSKEANSFKNSYYKALDKFKEKKGK